MMVLICTPEILNINIQNLFFGTIMVGEPEPGLLEGVRAGADKKNYRKPELEQEPVKTPKNGSREPGARPFLKGSEAESQ